MLFNPHSKTQTLKELVDTLIIFKNFSSLLYAFMLLWKHCQCCSDTLYQSSISLRTNLFLLQT